MIELTVTTDPAATMRLSPDELDAATELDLRGLRCPMPVLRTRKALTGLRPGELLRVSCTDPLAGLDIPHLVGETGDVLVSVQRTGTAHVFLIRKS